MIDVKALFEKHENEWEFAKIANPLHQRPDICAFLLLDQLAPSKYKNYDMIVAAEHDQIWLDADIDELAKNATEDDIITLRRCGVFIDDEHVSMFA